MILRFHDDGVINQTNLNFIYFIEKLQEISFLWSKYEYVSQNRVVSKTTV